MGSRGVVAVRTGPRTWKGLYNQFDSYPEGLGAAVWERLKAFGVAVVAEELLRYGDWREYLAEGVCKFCGKKHGSGVADQITQDDQLDGLEWVYILDPVQEILEVWSWVSHGKRNSANHKYMLELIDQFPTGGEQPDWTKVHKRSTEKLGF
jgi:hypothetical protein